MNHILKKTIQCLLSIFCVFGIMNTPVNTVKADEEYSIYICEGYSNNNGKYTPNGNWNKRNASESYKPPMNMLFVGISNSSENSISISSLETISYENVMLKKGEKELGTTNVNVKNNYVLINTNNLDAGEYTLTIKSTILQIKLEKAYLVIVDSNNQSENIFQSSQKNFEVGEEYMIDSLYFDDGTGSNPLDIETITEESYSSTMPKFLDITKNDDGKYKIKVKDGFTTGGGKISVTCKGNRNFDIFFSVARKESYIDGCSLNLKDDNSFEIECPKESELSLNGDYSLVFGGISLSLSHMKLENLEDGKVKVTGDSSLFACGGSYVPKGEYKILLENSMDDETKYYNLTNATDGTNKFTLSKDINKSYPSNIQLNFNEEDGLTLSCSGNGCSAYLDTLYATQMAQSPYISNDGNINSEVNISFGKSPMMLPMRGKTEELSYKSIFNKVPDENGNTIALNVPTNTMADNSKTNFTANETYTSYTIHVLGYADYSGSCDFTYGGTALPEGTTLIAKWEDNKIILETNLKSLFEFNEENLKFETEEISTGMGSGRVYTGENSKVYKCGENYCIVATPEDYYKNILSWYGKGELSLNVYIQNNTYGRIYADNNPFEIDNPYSSFENVKGLSFNVIGDGFIVKAEDTNFYEDVLGNLKLGLVDLAFYSSAVGTPNIEVQIVDEGYKFVKDDTLILKITKDELEALTNVIDKKKSFDITKSYYPVFGAENYGTETFSNFAYSLSPIILAASKDTVANTSASELQSTLSKLDETATKLQNVTVEDTENNNTDVSIVGNVAGAITENYEQGNMDSDLNLLPDSDDSKETITVKTDISNLDTEEANKLADKVGGEATTAIDVTISKEYKKDRSKNTEVTELPYDSVLTFDLPEASEEETYVVVREHKESNGTTSYTLLDVTENEDGTGSVASSKFSKFALVKQTTIEMVESPKSSTTEGSKTSLKFKTYKKATNVYLDNELVNPNNYVASEDGTVTLKGEYVSKLSVGKHTLKIITTKGMASSEFEIAAKKTNTTSKSTKTTNGWDDGGPFTTDTCGNVYDRWGNKIYEAKGCNVGGYNLVRTSVED